MDKYILAIDQGTTSSRAIIFDGNGKVVCKSQHEFEQLFPKPCFVLHIRKRSGTVSICIGECR